MEKLVKNLEESLISAIWDSRWTLSDQIKEISKEISDKIDAINVAKAKEDLNVPKSEEVPDPFSLYEDCSLVGGGVSGEVYKVYDKTANEYFVLKCIPLQNNLIPPWIAREMSMLYDLDHDNIVKLKKAHPSKSHLYLLLEFAGVDLRAFLQNKAEKVPVKLIKDWLRQLLSAVSYLHDRDIVHRDLKPENMIIGSDLKLKITDFGSARRLKDATRLTPDATTLIFMPPEMLMGDENYGKAIDMWSVGCTLVEMVEKESPFAAKHGQSSPSSVLKEIFRKIGNPRKGSKLLSLPHYPKDEQEYLKESDAVTSLVPSLDVEGNDLLKKLLMVDPIERITAEEALSHPFLEEQPFGFGHNGMVGPSLDLPSGSSSTFETPPFQRICIKDEDKFLMAKVSFSAIIEVVRLLQKESSFWIRSSIDGYDVLNPEVYDSNFPGVTKGPNVRVESSKGSSVVNCGCLSLVDIFMDANKWMEFFPTIISRATTIEVISTGLKDSRNGLIQLMYEEMQVLSPLVPIREVYFLRFCQQISQHLWAIVDVSYDFPQEPHSNSQSRARRRPSGCFIEDKLDGYSKVTWMEHMEIEDIRPINNLYREQILSGLAFGVARRLATLQRRCERLAREKNVGKFDLGGVIKSSQGKRSLMKFSQKMVDSFCSSINAYNGQQVMISGMNDTEVRATLQKCNDPGLPNSMVLSAATTIRLPFTPLKIFDFLRDESCRPQWDVLSNIGAVKEVSHVVCGYHHPENRISVLEALNSSQKKFILQESCLDSSGSLVVSCTLDLPDDINKVMSSEDLLFIPVLSLGFAISPDAGERYGAGEILSVGSLVTVVVQTLQSNPKSGSVNRIKSMLENTVGQVKAALNCPS